jgi:type I restriction enzyme R subunit
MSGKEAVARIKTNKLLETAGWRFFSEGSAPAITSSPHKVKQ